MSLAVSACYSPFLSVTVLFLAATVVFLSQRFFGLLQCFPLCYSDAGLGTGADISSARRWISLAVTGCYSVFSGGYNVFSVCYSDAVLSTGADISSVRRWISLSSPDLSSHLEITTEGSWNPQDQV